MKRRSWLASLFALFMLPATVCADDPQADLQDPKNFWMKEKLELTQDVLAALAMDDLDTVATKANRLKRLSTIEGWARRTDAEAYRRQLRIFQRTAETLVTEAEDKNLDGATLAFTQMTLSCVNCHKELRNPSKTPARNASE